MATDLIPDKELADAKEIAAAKEIADIKDYLEEGLVVADKTWVPKLHASKDHPRDLKDLQSLEVLQVKVEKGEIDGMTMNELQKLTVLDRDWTEKWLIGIAEGTHSTVNNHRFSYASK